MTPIGFDKAKRGHGPSAQRLILVALVVLVPVLSALAWTRITSGGPARPIRSDESVQAMLCTVAFGICAILLLVRRGWMRERESHLAAIQTLEWHGAILDSMPHAILILDGEGVVEAMNAAAIRMLDCPPADPARRDIAAILERASGDDDGDIQERTGRVDGHPRRVFLADRTISRRDGRSISVDVALGVLNRPDGVRIVMALYDRSGPEHASRRQDDLRATINHEMRTPLTSVIGALGLLRGGAVAGIPPEADRLVNIADINSRLLIRLIDDMLDIDRIGSGKLAMVLASFDLRDVIDQACTGGEGLARAAGVALHCVRGDHAAIVTGDSGRLLQVVANLLSNAVRLSPSGTMVELGLAIDGRQATVHVDDCGSGVPPAFRDRIFGRFERADRGDRAGGTGLGLAISREIVTRHGGAIWFEDRAGGGTRFAFALPLADAAGVGDIAGSGGSAAAAGTSLAPPDEGNEAIDRIPRHRGGGA